MTNTAESNVQDINISIQNIITYLKNYDKTPLTLMEVCGSHTAAIAKYGIKSLISDKIRLISGPGCPVCVTPSSYIDRLIELAKLPNHCVVTFGDLLRVPGSLTSLNGAKADGANVAMVYSPADIIPMAQKNPSVTFVFAAVGFETTTPVYALLVERLLALDIHNIQLLTALKTMPAAIELLCAKDTHIDAFLAPGHVCAITGTLPYQKLANKLCKPFGVSGFSAEELLIAIFGIVKMCENSETTVKNFYPSVVTTLGNTIAQEKVATYFAPGDTVWRGMGNIPHSGMYLRKDYLSLDAGSFHLTEDTKKNEGCCCGKILTGTMSPLQCPLFGKVCSPENPQGACMVSLEGSCYQAYLNQ